MVADKQKGPLARRIADDIAGASARESFSRAQRLSARHSLYVTAMKLLLPAVALGLVGLVVAWPQLRPEKARFRLTYASMTTDAAGTISMVQPRFTGVDDGKRPFTVTAAVATQISKEDASLVSLEEPVADMTLDDGSWVQLHSNAGLYNRKSHDLELYDAVDLFHDAGHEFHTTEAVINLKAGTAYGDKPVQGQGPFGRLTAQGFRVTDQGKTIVFTGEAKLLLYRNAEKKRTR